MSETLEAMRRRNFGFGVPYPKNLATIQDIHVIAEVIARGDHQEQMAIARNILLTEEQCRHLVDILGIMTSENMDTYDINTNCDVDTVCALVSAPFFPSDLMYTIALDSPRVWVLEKIRQHPSATEEMLTVIALRLSNIL